MSGNEVQSAPKIVLLQSEIEAAAARVAERAMNDTWTGASGFVGDVFGGLVGDRVKFWRTRNLVDTLFHTKLHLDRRGVVMEKAKSLPMGELITIFEGASKTEDVGLRQMWAAPLANVMDPRKDTFIDPAFARILPDLSGLDARILRYIERHREVRMERDKTVGEIRAQYGYVLIHSDEEKATASRAAMDAAREKYLSEATTLRDEIEDHYSELNIAYSLSNLLRLDLITEGSGLDDDELVKVHIVSDERVLVDTRALRSELVSIWNRFDRLNEDSKSIPRLSVTTKWTDQVPVPSFDITGLGHRFLQACS